MTFALVLHNKLICAGTYAECINILAELDQQAVDVPVQGTYTLVRSDGSEQEFAVDSAGYCTDEEGLHVYYYI